MKKNKLKLFILAIGIILLVITVKLMYDSTNYLNNAKRAWATVTGYNVKLVEEDVKQNGRTVRETRNSYYHQFQFRDQKNRVIQLESSIGNGDSGAYQIGTKVMVLYMEDNPKDAMINNFTNLWLRAFILGFFAFVFLLIGYN